MTNSKTDLAEYKVIDSAKYQILNVLIEREDGTLVPVSVPMPYLFEVEELGHISIKNVTITEPYDLPEDSGFEVVEGPEDGSE